MSMNRRPDVVNQTKALCPSRLEKVGMENIDVPVRLQIEGLGPCFQMAEADAYVSLYRKNVKGIHMSRLFIILQKSLEHNNLSIKIIKEILEKFLSSHKDLSDHSFLNLRFKYPIEKKSLSSNNTSWKKYNVEFKASMRQEDFKVSVSFRVLYSSTCPCSAALSRQLIQKNFKDKIKEKDEQAFDHKAVYEWLGQEGSMIATPHSQRSEAKVTVSPSEGVDISIEDLVHLVEGELKTPVQSIVKREDEQEFAYLNGTNLMFAEDACRKIKKMLNKIPYIKNFKIKVSHFESLHAHDAVAFAEKDQ